MLSGKRQRTRPGDTGSSSSDRGCLGRLCAKTPDRATTACAGAALRWRFTCAGS
jgi:hypothetical protein